MKRLILILFILINVLSFKASHIVGGDFKVDMVTNGTSGSDYNIQLRLYRDDVNGIALPTQLTIGIYEIGTNNLVTCKTLYETGASLVPLGDPCYTPDPNVVRIEEKIYQTISTVTLPNFTFGYYLQYEVCCRNQLATNLATPTSDGITIFAIIPDPGLGQNSTPDFGNYPNDAYFCVNSIKQFTYPVTDPDGDQLVYSLVAPLDEASGFGTCSNSAPGSGVYPFYPDCVFSAGYNVSNMIGGPPNYPAMSIDAASGEITAAPTAQGFYAFAVRVEEYRNGVKIGEVRRELQYASLPCGVTSNPAILSINDFINSDSVNLSFTLGDSSCIDIGIDYEDSVFSSFSSNNFNLLLNYIQPDTFNVIDSNSACNYIFNMYDSFGDGWNGASVDISINGVVTYSGIGSSFTSGSSDSYNLIVSNGDIISIPSGNWTAGSWDSEVSWDIQDFSGIVIASGCHPSSLSCTYIDPGITVTCPSSSTSHAYLNWNNTSDTVFFNKTNFTTPGIMESFGSNYFRFCWTPTCNNLDDTLLINLNASYNTCDSYTINSTVYIDINLLDSLSEYWFGFVAYSNTATYQWLDCNDYFAPIPGQNNAVFSPSLNGDYALEITNNGCVDTTDCFSFYRLSLNDQKSDLSIFPNPTSGKVDLKKINGIFTADVYDFAGKHLQSTYSSTIDLTDYPKGIYLLKVSYGDRIEEVKVVKE